MIEFRVLTQVFLIFGRGKNFTIHFFTKKSNNDLIPDSCERLAVKLGQYAKSTESDNPTVKIL